MIFVTVGSQTPFDRLVKAMDLWAMENTDVEVFAQIGRTEYVPKHMRWAQELPPDQYTKQFREAELVIAHAGMGTVFTAMDEGKTLVLLPRVAANKETRNDHQLATVKWLRDMSGIYVVDHEAGLPDAIASARCSPRKSQKQSTSAEEFANRLRVLIAQL